jgi:hypothetical protein
MKLHLLFAVSLFAACGDSGGGTTSPDAMTIGCINDPRAMTYTADMMLTMTATQKLKFELVNSMPGPPVKGNNTWQVKLLDANNQPVTGAMIKVTPFMPDHGHGTSVVPQVTPMGDGYTVTPLYLFMAGLWQVTIEVDSSPAGADSAVFYFCIPG